MLAMSLLADHPKEAALGLGPPGQHGAGTMAKPNGGE